MSATEKSPSSLNCRPIRHDLKFPANGSHHLARDTWPSGDAVTKTELQPLPASLRLRDALQASGVFFVHWKSNNHLSEALAGQTDLDLYIRTADRRAFEDVMREMRAHKLRSQPWANYPGVEDWLVLDDSSMKFLHLHVHYQLITGLKRVKHLHLAWESALHENVRLDRGSQWPIPTAELELLMLLVRIWAKMPPWRRLLHPKIPAHILRELDFLKSESTLESTRETASKLGIEIDPKALEQLYEFPIGKKAILALARRLYAQLRPNYRMNWSRSLLQAAWRNTRLLITNALAPLVTVKRGKTLFGKGFMIAIIGADGSGKSSLTRDLANWLGYKLDVHRFYMGTGDGAGGFVNGIRKRVAALFRSRMQKKGTLRPGSELSSTIDKIYRLTDLLVMRRKLRLLRLGRRLASKGSIILLDRYPQDQVNAISDGPRLQEGRGFTWAARRELKLYREAMVVGPDLVIRLSVAPQTALVRKPDHDPRAIARKCNIVEKLEFPQSMVVSIDANRPYDEVLIEAKRELWRFMSEAQPHGR
jgi:thymidylate kinase